MNYAPVAQRCRKSAPRAFDLPNAARLTSVRRMLSLHDRARAAGVQTGYHDWSGAWLDIASADLEAVLHALGDPPPSDRLVAGTVVARPGSTTRVELNLPADSVRAWVETEDGSRTEVRPTHGSVELPALPMGWHALVVACDSREERATIICAPVHLAWPDERARLVGWQVQTYQLRSARSWGMGDYVDLATFCAWAGEHGAGAVLVNPLHAPVLAARESGRPLDSPYSPTSRRFLDVLSIAPDQLPEVASLTHLSAFDDLFKAANDGPREPVDRSRVWKAKRAALEMLHAVSEREVPADASRDAFAAWCSEAYGGSAAFHAWLQVVAAEQLDAVAAAAPSVRLVLDVAVGVDVASADAALLADDLAHGATIGAPPDSFNQLGQDWALPPLRPDRLAETGYAVWREVVRSALAHGGGLRVDHVMGLSRLWWVTGPGRGAYVTYDIEAMLAVVVLEASRAGAFVVGEDLGTVEPAVTEALEAAGVLGSDVLWFQQQDDGVTPIPPEGGRAASLATVTTHDLPTVAGFVGDVNVELRGSLGLLESLEDERARLHVTRDALLDLCRERGWLPASINPGSGAVTDPEEVRAVSDALHRAVLASPARVVLASLGDALGDSRQPNLPGTTQEYPSWTLLLASAAGEPLLLEQVLADPGVAALAALLVE